ncbi:MAG: dihydrodipicolinate synthase family protein [Thermoplasmata archaeon]
MSAAPRSLWRGVLVAITTPFRPDGEIDRAAFVRHARWLAGRRVDAIVTAGSLGEGSTLSAEERVALITDLVAALPADVPVIAAVAAARTDEAVAQARRAKRAGARGLLVLPPYVYRGDRAETRAHFGAVFSATDLPCMLYNNPPAYGTDVEPDDVEELARTHPTLAAAKESSGDARRIAALTARLGPRVEVAVGLDDCVLDGVRAGAVGWVAGLANALPDESVALFSAAVRADVRTAGALYRWFRPLLQMDTGPKFVQRIKLVQAELGWGNPRVRMPRLELGGAEREETEATLRACLARRPRLPSPVGPEGADASPPRTRQRAGASRSA